MLASERLARRLVSLGECLVWTGATDPKGYGIIRSGGAGSPTVRTHRLAWELANGPIPAGMWVLHRCDTPGCCNPEHLFLGDHEANMRDMVEKGRARSLSGEASPKAKLSDADVRSLRAMAPGRSYAELGRIFDVNPETARRLALGLRRTA